MPERRSHQIADIILAIEAELRRVDAWKSEPPTKEALKSDSPFCCDTLEFTEWLQWIFLPKMNYILQNNLTLPGASAILPYAEEALAKHNIPSDELLRLIKKFDRIIESIRSNATFH